jgi:hypothetical protein
MGGCGIGLIVCSAEIRVATSVSVAKLWKLLVGSLSEGVITHDGGCLCHFRGHPPTLEPPAATVGTGATG